MHTKKEVIVYLIEEVEKLIPVKTLEKQKKLGTIVFDIKNDCKVSFSFDTVLAGSKGKNSFVISFHMVVFNPMLDKVITAPFGKENINDINYGLVLSLSYLNSLPKEWAVYSRYMFDNSKDYLDVANVILEDIKKYFIPYIQPLTGDYNQLLDMYKDPTLIKNIGNWRQFITGVAAAILTDRESEIGDTIVPLAKANDKKIEFLEFKNSKNYEIELIKPIKDYIDKNRIK
ncbi:hypothetical protein G6M26_30740 [Agrobacterium tumefaciens]|nr:hypothetical protein [Agrobacterium tumefaciens]